MENIEHPPKAGSKKRYRVIEPSPEEAAWLDRELEKALARIKILDVPEPAPEELDRRRQVADRILAIRDSMEPLDVPVADLIRELRGWPDDGEDHDEADTSA